MKKLCSATYKFWSSLVHHWTIIICHGLFQIELSLADLTMFTF